MGSWATVQLGTKYKHMSTTRVVPLARTKQETGCIFTSRSVPNTHFIRVDFTVDSVATDIEDKRNKETRPSIRRKWLAEKYLPLILGTVISTSLVTFQQQKPRESNTEYFETMLNMLNLQNDLADVAFGDLFNFYPLNAFSPTIVTQLTILTL